MMPGFRTKKAFFANITGTSKETKFLFHLHEQAPDQKKHLKVLLVRQTGKLKLKGLASSAAIQAMNSMQMRQKRSDFLKTKEYSMHC